MIPVELVSMVSLLYIGLLFAVATYADRMREAGQSIIANSYVYSLSLTVLFTSYSFYGMVGRAATNGIEYISDGVGTTLMAFSWWFLLRKMVRCSKQQNILSLADFISCRYGKSTALGGVVTVFSLAAVMPQIALQLKAVAHSFDLLTSPKGAAGMSAFPHAADTALICSVFLGIFAVLFGARRLDASERHEGLVAVLALQSVVKLVAMLCIGIFVSYGLFNGFTDVIARFTESFPDRLDLFEVGTPRVSYPLWFTRIFIGMMVVIFLPRQFHISVVENSDEQHIRDAMWHFPVYAFMLLLFVMPIALGGTLLNGGDTSGADYFVIHLPLQQGHRWLALLAFMGGLSASTGMVILELTVLSTMILNYLLMPVILKWRGGARDLSRFLLGTKRAVILALVLLGYLSYRSVSHSFTLISMGVVTSMAAAQFGPSIIGGLYWRRATRSGAMSGLVLGALLWFYTLLVPILVQAGMLDPDIVLNGPLGLSFLCPLQLFGLSGLDMLSHTLFWTMFFNLGAFIAVSLFTEPDKTEIEQIANFVDVFRPPMEPAPRVRMSKSFEIAEFAELMAKFIGEKQSHAAIAQFLDEQQLDVRDTLSEYELPVLKRFTERILAGSVGAAAAGVIVDSYLATRGSALEDVFDIFGTVTLSRTATREQLGVLYEAARVVASSSDLQAVLDRILEQLQHQFKFDICVIRLLDESKNRLVVRSQKGMSLKHLEASEREVDLSSHSGTALLTNSVVLINDVDAIDKPLSAQIARAEGILSFAHAPITIEGKPVGVLSAFSKSMKGIFTEEFLELFQNLAGQVGIALRNERQRQMLILAKEHEKEMQIAKTIQLGLLPTCAPEVAGISLAGICIPASEVGGDYYDFLPHGSDCLDLVIADVSGHNVGAALLMTEARTFIQAEAANIRSPAHILGALNEFLYEDLSRAELFITMCYLRYRPDLRELSFASGGHNPPVLWRSATGACERLDAEGMILGVCRGISYEERQVSLNHGDLLLLFTDGITEATDPTGNFFGEARLCSLLHQYHPFSPREIIDFLVAEVRSFAQTESLADDLSLVVMKLDRATPPVGGRTANISGM